jgi:hypothetical protein
MMIMAMRPGKAGTAGRGEPTDKRPRPPDMRV